MMQNFDIQTVSVAQAASQADEMAQALADVLLDCVEQGASVSFMWPLARENFSRSPHFFSHAVAIASNVGFGVLVSGKYASTPR